MTTPSAVVRDPEADSQTPRSTLPAGLSFHHAPADDHGHHRIDAHIPDELHGNRPIGLIIWRPGDGEVQYIHTDHRARRRDVATALWHQAHTYALRTGSATPRHSPHQTSDGA
ncbi:MAG: hypothetical protein JO362_12100, partial [Streptomycetaceae bacterium]|nr:hypothetical protein [Streptomycetaceae bacterium]